MVHVVFLSKDRVLIKFGLSRDFLTQRDSGCPSEGKFLSKERALVRLDCLGLFGSKRFKLPQSREKGMNQIGLTWDNGKSLLLGNMSLDINRG